MVMPACCCKVLSCKHVLTPNCIPTHVIVSIAIFAISFNSIAPTAIICIRHFPLSCKQPLQPLAAASPA
jgi:hypothetical protein